MITFSVVTITYNAAQVLQPTLDSVLMQDYPHVEHLIIDGASTDNTVAIAEAYRKQSGEAENGHTVRIQSEPDNGLYDAMNKGLQLATGDYVVFLNAGDRFPAADTLDRVVLAAVVGDGEERPIPTSSTGKATSSATAASLRLHGSPGVPSATACWYATRHSMPGRTSHVRCRMIPPTAIRRT